jgi:lactate permease
VLETASLTAFSMPWSQVYDPFSNSSLSTTVAALPVVALLGLLASGRIRAWWAALIGLAVAGAVAILAYGMPGSAALGAAGYGVAHALFPVGWIIVNVLFLHRLTVISGRFDELRLQLASWVPDPRVQVILIAFGFGAFVEGAAGFGAPVAITAALLLQLGFNPLQASGLALIANTAPVAFGSLGLPLITLQQVTGLDLHGLSAMAGRQLPLFSAVIPAWIVAVYGGWKALRSVWPMAAAAGLSFGLVQWAVSNFHGPWLVDAIAAVASLGSTLLAYRWFPTRIDSHPEAPAELGTFGRPGAWSWSPWWPWMILMVFIFLWGIPSVKAALDHLASTQFEVPGLHLQVQRMPPVVDVPRPESVFLKLNFLSATGTGVLLAGILSGWVMGLRTGLMVRTWWRTWYEMRFPLLTIAGMLALGNLTKYSGADATLGLALAHTGPFYPFFGTLLGWMGVALTGSDTAANVLFGSLQQVTAHQLGVSPYLMAAANSTGGVMGKMIDAQSIVVAGAATGSHGGEGKILRYVFPHSLVLAVLMGLWVAALAGFKCLSFLVVR